MTEALNPHDPSWGEEGEIAAERRANRLLGGLAAIAERTSRVDGERLLFLLGAVAVPLGVVLVVIGWYGSAGSGLVFEQIPYLVSGGLGGLGLIVIGCTLYACWWVTRAIRDQRERHEALRRQNEELVEAVHELRRELARLRPPARRR